ncbi:MAG TPA: hypothetical protein VK428_15890 [Acidimicrobiales bacterium]|nr:hypothetical protein [Acidimicrobiales bacterium]
MAVISMLATFAVSASGGGHHPLVNAERAALSRTGNGQSSGPATTPLPSTVPTTATSSAPTSSPPPTSVPPTTVAPPTTAAPSAAAPSSPAPTASTVSGPTGGEPAKVAVELIMAVNRQAAGRYLIPATTGNIALLEHWMADEGGLWADNPLNTSLDAAKYPHQITSSGSDTGIPIFPTMQDGVDATAQTLLRNGAYASILTLLSTGTATCTAFADAVIASPWAASHYGHDPSAFCGSTVSGRRSHHRHSGGRHR